MKISEKGVRYDSQIVRFDFEIVQYDPNTLNPVETMVSKLRAWRLGDFSIIVSHDGLLSEGTLLFHCEFSEFPNNSEWR
jgi:hypothetical protein